MRNYLYLFTLIFLAACGGENKKQTTTSAIEEPQVDPMDAALQNREDSLNQVLRAEPGKIEALLERAKVNFQQQELDVAIGDVNRALEQDSTLADARFLLGKFQFFKDDFYEAQLSFERCMDDNPEYIPCIEKMGEIYLLQGNFNEAITYINKALRINEHNYYPYYLKGLMYKQMGDSAKAASSLQTAVELNPDFYDGYVLLGSLYYGANDPLCLDYFDAALNVNPESTEAMYFKAMFYQNNLMIEEALAQYRELRAVDPQDVRAWYNPGFVKLTQTGGFDSAVYYFDQAIAIFPKYHQAYYNRGLAWLELGDTDKAKADFEQAKTIDPNYTLAIQALNELNGDS